MVVICVKDTFYPVRIQKADGTEEVLSIAYFTTRHGQTYNALRGMFSAPIDDLVTRAFTTLLAKAKDGTIADGAKQGPIYQYLVARNLVTEVRTEK